MQFSRIMQRAPATDLSGPKAFAESLTPQSNWVVVGAAEFQFGWFLSAVFGSTLTIERETPGAGS